MTRRACVVLAMVALAMAQIIPTAVTAREAPSSGSDWQSFESRANVLEAAWREDAAAAASYFSQLGALFRSGASRVNDHTLRVAQRVLEKRVAAVTPASKRNALYDAQASIAQWMLAAPVEAADDATFARIRKEVAESELTYLAALRSRTQALGNPKVMMNIAPPVSAGGGLMVAGMSPARVKDPAARRAYEAAIADNERARAAVLERESTTSDARIVLLLTRNFIQRNYSRPPDNPAERVSLLQRLEQLSR